MITTTETYTADERRDMDNPPAALSDPAALDAMQARYQRACAGLDAILADLMDEQGGNDA